jgi:hypothetical protein
MRFLVYALVLGWLCGNVVAAASAGERAPLLIASSQVRPAGDRVNVISRWLAKNLELYDVTFSPDGTEIAFVQRSHWPDGHEAESVAASELTELKNRAKTEPRFNDPDVRLAAVSLQGSESVAWGWAPAFSPDARKIAFARQKEPLTGRRVLASTLAGNEIAVYDRTSKAAAPVAVPARGHFASPSFTPDGVAIVFAYGDAINGSWPGGVGLGRVDLSTKQVRPLIAPAKEHGFPVLVGPASWVHGHLLTLVQRPTSGGVHLAHSYAVSLLDATGEPRILYTWKSPLPAGEAEYRPATSGVQVRDGRWKTLGLRTDQGHAHGASEPESPGADEESYPSPDGAKRAVVREGSITIEDGRHSTRRAEFAVAGQVAGMTWSVDGSRLAIVTTHLEADERFVGDELTIVELR